MMPIDLENLYSSRGFEPKQKTHNELCGACPWCGGRDRFTLFLGQGKDGLGRYWCRQCGQEGDAIQFLRDLDGLSFKEAQTALGQSTTMYCHQTGLARARRTVFEPVERHIPSDAWQIQAKKVVEYASAQIKVCPDIMAWLAEKRGLDGATVRFFRLGWMPKNYFRPRSTFGLPEAFKEDGKPRKVYIPKGLCIPVFSEGNLLRVKFRLDEPGENMPKYMPLPQTPGTKCTAPLVIQSKKEDAPWQIVESELDAFLLAQEVGQEVSILATGSASMRPDAPAWILLKKAPRVLISLDFDEAGNKAACEWWTNNLPQGRAKIWPVPEGKDPCDAWRLGWNLADWTLEGLKQG